MVHNQKIRKIEQFHGGVAFFVNENQRIYLCISRVNKNGECFDIRTRIEVIRSTACFKQKYIDELLSGNKENLRV